MAFVKPDVDDFKDYFFRDFPYTDDDDLTGVTDESGKDDLEKEKKDVKAKNSKDSKSNFEKLKNAREKGADKPVVVELQHNALQRGKERY